MSICNLDNLFPYIDILPLIRLLFFFLPSWLLVFQFFFRIFDIDVIIMIIIVWSKCRLIWKSTADLCVHVLVRNLQYDSWLPNNIAVMTYSILWKHIQKTQSRYKTNMDVVVEATAACVHRHTTYIFYIAFSMNCVNTYIWQKPKPHYSQEQPFWCHIMESYGRVDTESWECGWLWVWIVWWRSAFVHTLQLATCVLTDEESLHLLSKTVCSATLGEINVLEPRGEQHSEVSAILTYKWLLCHPQKACLCLYMCFVFHSVTGRQRGINRGVFKEQ